MSYVEVILLIALIKLGVGLWFFFMIRPYFGSKQAEETQKPTTLLYSDEPEKVEAVQKEEGQAFGGVGSQVRSVLSDSEALRLNEISLSVTSHPELGDWKDLDELVSRVEKLRRVQITVLAHLPAGVHSETIASLCYRAGIGQYVVYYEPGPTTKSTPDPALLHQLAHILRGHGDLLPVIKTEDLWAHLKEGKPVEYIAGVYCRKTRELTESARETEYIGLELGRKILKYTLAQQQADEKYRDGRKFFFRIFATGSMIVGLLILALTKGNLYVTAPVVVIGGLPALFEPMFSFFAKTKYKNRSYTKARPYTRTNQHGE